MNKCRRKKVSSVSLLLFISMFSLPSAILLSNNFLSQGISFALVIFGFEMYNLAGKRNLSLRLALIGVSAVVVSLSILNHISAFFLAAALLLTAVNKKYSSSFPIKLFIFLAFISISIFAIVYASAYSTIWEGADITRLVFRVFSPYLIYLLIFPLKSLKSALHHGGSVLQASTCGSAACIVFFILGYHGLAWRLEYYFSFLAMYVFVRIYSMSFIRICKPNLGLIPRLILLTLLNIMSYSYDSINRIFA